MYGGCGKTKNIFDSKRKCEDICGGGRGQIPAKWLRQIQSRRESRDLRKERKKDRYKRKDIRQKGK